AHPDANIIFGAVIDPNLQDTLRITVIATGFDAAHAKQQPTTTAKTIEFPSRPYDQENRDIPAFLRRARGGIG
ncbi:MAG: cell division protein FtsZ, partial [Caldilineales bacterium]|nr:cell division protein FtsZ [Caldilineales bacterium]